MIAYFDTSTLIPLLIYAETRAAIAQSPAGLLCSPAQAIGVATVDTSAIPNENDEATDAPDV